MVELNHVTYAYPNGAVGLTDVSVVVQDGEFCFLTGKSGSGKTTITKLLTGEIGPSEGSVKVNGYMLGHLSHRGVTEARRTVGMVFQDFRLISTMTVAENLEFAMRCIGASTQIIAQRIPQVLDLVAMRGKEDRYPSELSGGEQQRAAIARAIVNHPSLIIADEPTGNLDPQLSEEIMQLFVRINELGTTTIVVTHAKELVDKFQKRVLVLKNGALISDEEKSGYEVRQIQDGPIPPQGEQDCEAESHA